MSVFPLNDGEVTALLDQAFAEDVASGDVTCALVIGENENLTATMNAREDMVVVGTQLATATFKRLDVNAEITTHVSDGDKVTAGTPLMTISGKARALLTGERTALNIMQHLSGIATLTKAYVDQINHTEAKLLDTRKTIPGLRALAKYATLMGGSTNHRMGLFDAVMIKDNHLAVAGSVEKAVKAAKSTGRSDIQVECDTLEQVTAAVDAGANSLLLDNMSPATLCEALALVDGKIPCEASGGVTLDTIKKIAETGVNYISVGRLTQSAPAVDIGLDYRS